MTRRDFIKTSAAATATVVLPSGVFAQGSDTIKVGIVGCGGRGTGAVIDAVNADKGVQLVAMGDVFKDHMDGCVKTLKDQIKGAFKVTPDKMFIGFDAYEHVMKTDCDVVILATPPGFRYVHLKAAIDAGPMACDVTRVKIPMLAARDFSVQAATADAFQSTRLIADAARAIGIATPLLDQSRALYGESVELGNSRRDMVSVLEAIEARTRALQKASESVASVSVISTPEAQ